MAISSNLALIKLEISENFSSTPGNSTSIPLLKLSCTDEGAKKVVQVVEQLKSKEDPFIVQVDLSKPCTSDLEGTSFSATSGTKQLRALERRIAQAIKRALDLPRAPSTLQFHVYGIKEERKPVSGSFSISLSIQPSTHLCVELSHSPKPSTPPTPLQPSLPQPSGKGPSEALSLPEQKSSGLPPIRFYSASAVPVFLSVAPVSHNGSRSVQPPSISKRPAVPSDALSVVCRPPVPRIVLIPGEQKPSVCSAPPAHRIVLIPDEQKPLVCSAPPAATHNSEPTAVATQVAASALVQLQTQTAKAPSGREALHREIAASVSVLCHDVAMVRSRLTALDPVVSSDESKTEEGKRFVDGQIAELKTRIEGLEGLVSLIDRVSKNFDRASTL